MKIKVAIKLLCDAGIVKRVGTGQLVVERKIDAKRIARLVAGYADRA